MNEHNELQVAEWLRNGIAAAKTGRRDEARHLLLRVIEENERSEQAWLWLSAVVDSDEDRLVCLENTLTLNPENVQARAGLRHLQERGVAQQSATGMEEAVSGTSYGALQEFSVNTGEPTAPSVETAVRPQSVVDQGRPVAAPKPSDFLPEDGCVYCGLAVGERAARCPYCGKRLAAKHFKKVERSPVAYLLHVYWLLLAGLNLADFFLIGYVWDNLDSIPELVRKYLLYVVGPVVAGSSSIETFLDPTQMIAIVRYALLVLAVLDALVAVGVFLRRPLAHTAGIGLVALQLILGLAWFILGFLGYLLAAFRALLTVMLTVFMFNTVEDFAQEERRERLVPDRRAVNDADFYTRGRAYEKRGMWAKALLHWQRAAVINPKRDTYYAAMARAYTHLGRYDDAIRQIDEALRVSRTPDEWHALRQVILDARDRAAG